MAEPTVAAGRAEGGSTAGEAIARGAARLLFVIGTAVAITATGRLAPVELVVAAFSFSYVPLIQLVALAGALRLVAPAVAIRRAYALYLAGHRPWLAALLLIAALFLIAPAKVLFAVVPVVILGTFAWGVVLTYRCLRLPLGLTRARAAIGTTLHTVFLTALVVTYYLGMGQLGPQLWQPG